MKYVRRNKRNDVSDIRCSRMGERRESEWDEKESLSDTSI